MGRIQSPTIVHCWPMRIYATYWIVCIICCSIGEKYNCDRTAHVCNVNFSVVLISISEYYHFKMDFSIACNRACWNNNFVCVIANWWRQQQHQSYWTSTLKTCFNLCKPIQLGWRNWWCLWDQRWGMQDLNYLVEKGGTEPWLSAICKIGLFVCERLAGPCNSLGSDL